MLNRIDGGRRAACLSDFQAFEPRCCVATGYPALPEKGGITYRTGNLLELGKWLVGSSAFDDLEKWQRLFAMVILKLLFAQP